MGPPTYAFEAHIQQKKIDGQKEKGSFVGTPKAGSNTVLQLLRPTRKKKTCGNLPTKKKGKKTPVSSSHSRIAETPLCDTSARAL